MEMVLDQGYAVSSCDFCGGELRFQSAAAGRNAECPNCGRVVQLSTSRAPVPLEIRPAGGERRVVHRRSLMRKLAFFVGWVIFPAGLLALVGSMLAPFTADQAVARAIALGFYLLANAAGLALILEGRRVHTSWICSSCEHRLETHDALTCTTCHVELR